MESVSLKMSWTGTLNLFLALYENGDRKYAREQLQNMARIADLAVAAADAFTHIADMTDRDGNAIEMHRDELRAIARSALEQFKSGQTTAGANNEQANKTSAKSG
jgi:hypothetical protein